MESKSIYNHPRRLLRFMVVAGTVMMAAVVASLVWHNFAFLLYGGMAIAAYVLFLAVFTPYLPFLNSKGDPAELVEVLGCTPDATHHKKALVVYGTRHGSAREAAITVSDDLQERGYAVDVRPAEKAMDIDLSPYDSVVIGSSIYWARLTPATVAFMRKHQEALSKKSFSLFTVCLSLIRDKPKNRIRVANYIKKSFRGMPGLMPKNIGMFAGRIDLDKTTLGEWIIVKFLLVATGLPAGDHLDPPQIKAWLKQAVPQG